MSRAISFVVVSVIAAICNFGSRVVFSLFAPYTIAASPRPIMMDTTVGLFDASGKSGMLKRMKPKVPSLMPARTTAIPIGPSRSASGSHV